MALSLKHQAEQGGVGSSAVNTDLSEGQTFGAYHIVGIAGWAPAAWASSITPSSDLWGAPWL